MVASADDSEGVLGGWQAMLKFLLLVLTGAFVGIITNYLALKLIFRPVNPIKLGPLTIQGIVYKKRDQIAHNLAEGMHRVMPFYLKLPVISQMVQRQVEENLKTHSAKELEELIYNVAGREIQMIEFFWGGVIGAIITAIVLVLSGGVA
jgi:uncharacterized membrane protein YheB (UPF0754 family)